MTANERAIVLVEKLTAMADDSRNDAEKLEVLATLDYVRHILLDIDSMPPTLQLHKQGDSWSTSGNVASRMRIAWDVEPPVLESLMGERARLVVVIPEHVAKAIRIAFNVPMQPAPLDATEAIVRATHALAGATIELTHVLKNVRESS